jgi:hypothetical protein
MENNQEEKDMLLSELNDIFREQRSIIRQLKVDIITSIKKILLLIPNHSQHLKDFHSFYFNTHASNQYNTKTMSISKYLSASLVNSKLSLSVLINYQDVNTIENISEDDILDLSTSTKKIQISVESLMYLRHNLMFYLHSPER